MILVAGGTGRLGRVLVPALLERGEQVRVLARHASSASCPELAGAQLVTGDVRDPGSLAAAAEGVNTVISAVQALVDPHGGTPESVDRDGNAHLVEMAERVGAMVILLSTIGAAPSSPMEYFRSKWAAEEALRRSTVPWTVVRASAFAETWADVMAQTAGRSGRPVVFGRGKNPTNFVMVADVTTAVLRAVHDPALRGRVVEVGGPEDLTLTELAHRVQQAHDWTGAPRHVPRPLLRVSARVLSGVRPSLARQMRSAVAMDAMEARFDPAPSLTEHPWLTCSPVRLAHSSRQVVT